MLLRVEESRVTITGIIFSSYHQIIIQSHEKPGASVYNNHRCFSNIIVDSEPEKVEKEEEKHDESSFMLRFNMFLWCSELC